jgi:sec-independent protein translocase protein TatA
MGLDNPLHIFFLLVILLLVFGAKRLPELGRSLGTGMRGFKESISGEGGPLGHLEGTPATTATSATAVQLAEPVTDHPAVRPGLGLPATEDKTVS